MATTEPAEEFSLIRREARALREPFRLLLAFRQLRGAPSGAASVMVLPGFTTDDRVMAPLRAYLRSRGHTAWGWGLGVNRGEIDVHLPRVIEQVERRVRENQGDPIVLIGWSLGGVFAREVTRSSPELVSRVITIASPARSYSKAAGDPDAPTIDRPILAFYSKRDGVVGWRGSIDDLSPDVEMVEVESSHVGITLDPTVWLAIAERLRAVSSSEQ